MQRCFPLKRRLSHGCFPASFAKVLRTRLLQNISGRLSLHFFSVYFIYIGWTISWINVSSKSLFIKFLCLSEFISRVKGPNASWFFFFFYENLCKLNSQYTFSKIWRKIFFHRSIYFYLWLNKTNNDQTYLPHPSFHCIER